MAYIEYAVKSDAVQEDLVKVDTSVGRGEGCGVQMLHDPEISRGHCSIQRQNDKSYVLIDENSRNGTYVNGARVVNEELLLHDGDRIAIGQTTFVFRDTGPGRTQLLFNQVEGEIREGKGYRTILREITTRQ